MHRNLWQILADRRLWTGPAIVVAMLLIAVNFCVRGYRAWLIEEEKKSAQGGAAQHVVMPNESAARYDLDRKSTRLNSSHDQISYAVFCLKKKKKKKRTLSRIRVDASDGTVY